MSKSTSVKPVPDAEAPAQLPATTNTVGEIMVNHELLAQIDTMANRMASAKATIPKHLQGSEGDCWAVIMQAIQWRMNPYAVAQKTHLVNGTLGYEAQLVNAVVQSSGHIEGRFHYEYDGDKCRVGAVIKGEREITWNEWLSQKDVKTKNSPLWTTNPNQQMGYLQVKNWSRQYCPAAILGVYTPDELPQAGQRPVERDMGSAEAVDENPPPRQSRTSTVKSKISKAKPAEEKPEESPPIEGDLLDQAGEPEVRKVTADDVKTLREEMARCDVAEGDFCANGKIEKIEDLPLDRFAGAMTFIQSQATAPEE